MTTKEEILAGEPTEFKRENKYLVLKLSDIAKFLTRDEQFKLDELIKKIRVGRLNDGKQDQSYVCVASDWPMYEQVWAAVQAFVEGKPSQLDELRQQLAAAQAREQQLRKLLEHAPVSSGVCCCGDSMDRHPDPMVCGHSPVDQWDWAVLSLLKETQDTTALEAMIAKAGEVMRERCAVEAWVAYADKCKAAGLNPHNFGQWLCSDEIRALPGVKLEDLK